MRTILSTIVFFLLLGSGQRVFATMQLPEFLIIGEDTLSMFCEPIRWNKELNDYISQKCTWSSTGLYRGYVGMWRLKDDRLVLEKVYTGGFGHGYWFDNFKSKLLDLTDPIFDKYRIDGDITAIWFYGEARCGSGTAFRLASYMGGDYEFDSYFTFEAGRLVRREDYINTFVQADPSSKDTSWQQAWVSVDWNRLPEVDVQSIMVNISILPDSDGRIDSLNIELVWEKNHSPLPEEMEKAFRDELSRCLYMPPRWDVLTVRGKIQPLYWFSWMGGIERYRPAPSE